MAVVNVKATNVTNLDRAGSVGLPNVINPQLIFDGNVNEVVGLVAGAAGDSNNSTYRVARVWSGWRITSIQQMHDALGAGALTSIGIYDIQDNGGAVVSVALFAAGVDFSAAITTPLEHRFSTLLTNTVEQALWQLLGLAADPQKYYDLVFTTTVRGANAANMAGIVKYVTGQD